MNNVDKSKQSLDQAGAILDEVKAAASDPWGTVRKEVINRQQELISEVMAKALDYKNICNTPAKKAAFQGGGWDRAYYGKRLWDTRGVAMVVGAFFPATSAVAARELLSELKAQFNSVTSMVEKATKDAGEDLTALLQQIIQSMMDSALSGTVTAPSIDRDTFGIKGTILRFDCSSAAAGIKLPAEGYFQLALAFRIKQPTMKSVGSLPTGNLGQAAQGINQGLQQAQQLQCACRDAYRNPKTGAEITCACYYYNQETSRNCPGAKYGDAAELWYKDC